MTKELTQLILLDPTRKVNQLLVSIIQKKKVLSLKVITKILHLNNNLSDQVMNSLKKIIGKIKVTLLTHTSKLFLDSNFQNEIKELKNKISQK